MRRACRPARACSSCRIWVYGESRYLWRPGYWLPFRRDWVWTPAYYVWTPVGAVFVEGFWDYPLHDRGLIFAPIRFRRDFAFGVGFAFTPSLVIQTDFVLGTLFVRPASCHFYFGDYFEDRYVRLGFVPWIGFRIGKIGFDPNFAYYRHIFGDDRGWEVRLRQVYDGRRTGTIPRPPHSWHEPTEVVERLTLNNQRNANVVNNLHFSQLQNVTALTPLNQLHNATVTHLNLAQPVVGRESPAKVMRLEPVNQEQRVAARRLAEQHHVVAEQRRQAEARVLEEGKAPIHHTDVAHQAPIVLPQLPPAHEGRPSAEARFRPPPAPAAPRHEEHAVPAHEPFQPSRPPRQ